MPIEVPAGTTNLPQDKHLKVNETKLYSPVLLTFFLLLEVPFNQGFRQFLPILWTNCGRSLKKNVDDAENNILI
jgi:hypothetical protein